MGELSSDPHLYSLAEHDAGFPERLGEAELSIGGLVEITLALRQINHAARWLARIVDLEQSEHAPTKVDFVLLNEDVLRIGEELSSPIVDGALKFAEPVYMYDCTTAEGYFRAPRVDEIDAEWARLATHAPRARPPERPVFAPVAAPTRHPPRRWGL
jgi:hypothetical protein